MGRDRRYRSAGPARWAAAIVSFVGLWSSEAGADVFSTGLFSFSDELGGFRIVSVSGTGSKHDPVILEEEIFDIAPVTLVVRRIGPLQDRALFGRSLSLTKIVTNLTRRVWGGYELELQEIRDVPSVYADGLSFNQMDVRPPDVSSDRFGENNRLFEPHDRIRFRTGHVDHLGRARFSMVITDPTPVDTFYLLQHPQLLSAGSPGGGVRRLASSR